MGDLEKELSRLKEQLEKARAARSRAEAQLEVLEREKQRILDELAEMGVRPEELDGELARLEREMEALLLQVRQVLPTAVLGGKSGV